jgi:lipopolysaccharide/colanic/teichoic acid biosynthesis glycosyltransferase
MIARADTCGNIQTWQNAEDTPVASSHLWLPLQQWYLPCKSVVSFVFALSLLLVSAPVILLSALLVKLTSSGPVFYSQTRVGKNGRPYQIYKLRTMYHNCEKRSGPRWSTPGDPRITPLGRFLRRTHLDELPQLWNVVRGDMCLIGPRPERPEFIPRLAKALPHYPDRLLVKPGMTGLAQVQLPADTDLDSVRRKLAYDLYYVRHVSPWLDLSISFGTLLYLLGLPTRLMPRLRLVPKRQTVEQTYQDAAGPDAALPMVQPV